jgi:broad specificity phosphatase PhoE
MVRVSQLFILITLALTANVWSTGPQKTVTSADQFNKLYPQIATYLQGAKPAVRVIVMRHGESEANARGIAAGQTIPVFLTEAGKDEARQSAHYLVNQFRTFNPHIHSSPSFRALQTALEVAQVWNAERPKLIDIETSPALAERSFGKLEGMPEAELEVYVARGAKEFPNLPYEEKINYRVVPDMESIGDTFTRVYPYLTSLAKEAAMQGSQNLLVTVHGQILKTLFFELTAQQLGYEVNTLTTPNTSMLLLEWDGQKLLLKALWGVTFSSEPLLSYVEF